MSEPADPTSPPPAPAAAASPAAPGAAPASPEAPAPKPAAKRSFWAQSQPRPAAPAAAAAAEPAAPAAKPAAQKVAIPARVAKELDGLRGEAAKARAASKQLEAYRETLAAYATRELAGVPDAIKAMVAKRAGADPREQLALLNDLREAGLVGAAATPAQAAAEKLAPAATTAAPAAPKPGDAADEDLAAYQAWRAAKSKGADLIAARMRNDPKLGPRIERGAAKAAGN